MPDTDTLTDLSNRFEQLAVYALMGGSATVLKLNKDEMLLIRDLLLREQNTRELNETAGRVLARGDEGTGGHD